MGTLDWMFPSLEKSHFKPIGRATKTHQLDIILALAGTEQSLKAQVRYVNIPGNPMRFDEPARNPSVEILSIIVNDQDICWMLDEKTMESVMEEIL